VSCVRSVEACRPLLRFKKIFLEITNRCNLACAFCAPASRPPADLTAAECAFLLLQIKAHTDHVALHVLGEPLLHPELSRIMSFCLDLGLRVNLTTNGILLPEAGSVLLASPALRQVNISLHSVIGGGTAHDPGTYLAGVLTFAGQAAAAGIYVSLRLWDRPRQPAGDGRWQDWVRVRLAEFFALPEPPADKVDSGQGIRLSERIFLSRKELFDWPSMAGEEIGDRGSCPALRGHLAILVDGSVVPCCLDGGGEMTLGNLRREPLAAIIEGERARRLLNGFRQRRLVEELCRRCTYRERF
jgi:radical SAM protein with 4Fe4S-binding SPASM domain